MVRLTVDICWDVSLLGEDPEGLRPQVQEDVEKVGGLEVGGDGDTEVVFAEDLLDLLSLCLQAPRSRPCSLEEQYFKCGIFWDYDAPQRRVSNSEAPVLAGGIPVFLRGSQFSGASELKEGPVSKYKFINTTRLQLSYFCNCTIDLTKNGYICIFGD